MAKSEATASTTAAAAAAAVPLLSQQQQQQYYYGVRVEDPQHYLLLPLCPAGGHLRHRRCGDLWGRCVSLLATSFFLTALTALLLLGAAAFFLWPSAPDLRISRIRLEKVRISSKAPGALFSLDVAMSLKIRVHNPAFFALDYDSLRVSLGYRGRPLGRATVAGGLIQARGVSYVDTKLRLEGIRVLEDAFYLIEDIASGSIPFDAVTEVDDGELHFLSLDIPIEGRISCAMSVNVEEQTIDQQDCYPEDDDGLGHGRRKLNDNPTAGTGYLWG